MEKQILYNETKVTYQLYGNGPAITFIHGYMSSSKIWYYFVNELKEHFSIITIDLPGHGSSEVPVAKPEFGIFADAVIAVLEHEKIYNSVFIGHSMGGYISLDILCRYEKYVNALILFHSHPFSDSAERINFREKEEKLIKEGKKDILINVNAQNAFHESSIKANKDNIDLVRNIAIATPDEGCLFALKAMVNRDDTLCLIEKSGKPMLFIYGKYDPYLPHEKIDSISITNAQKLLLQNSAHYGFFEEPIRCRETVKRFLIALFQQ